MIISLQINNRICETSGVLVMLKFFILQCIRPIGRIFEKLELHACTRSTHLYLRHSKTYLKLQSWASPQKQWSDS